MQVYTTIYLAQKNAASLDCIEACAPDRPEMVEFEDSPRECIVTLECRNWFVDDGPDESS